MNESEDLMETAAEVAARFNVTPRTVRRWSRRYDFPTVRVGRVMRFPRRAVRRFVEERGGAR